MDSAGGSNAMPPDATVPNRLKPAVNDVPVPVVVPFAVNRPDAEFQPSSLARTAGIPAAIRRSGAAIIRFLLSVVPDSLPACALGAGHRRERLLERQRPQTF